MKIYIWSDFQCPFCYMGEKMLEQVIDSIDLPKPVEIVFKSYQLDPQAPEIPLESMTQHFMSSHDMTLVEAEKRMEKISDRAASIGLHYHLSGVRVCNTRDAHRLMKYASERISPGKMKRLNAAIFKANFEDNLLLSDSEVLAEIGVSVGLERKAVLTMLESDAYLEAVESDQQELESKADFDFIPYMLSSSGAVMQGILNKEKLTLWLRNALAGMDSGYDADEEREGCGPGGCSV